MTLPNKNLSRIVFIENEDLTRDSSGGVMSYLINLSKYFMDIGMETVLFGSGSIENTSKPTKKFSKFHSISKNPSISNFKFFLKLLTTGQLKYVDKGDILHVQRAEMVIPLALRKRNKIICTLHGGQDLAVLKKKGKFMGFIYLMLQFLAFKLVDELIVVDAKNKNRYVKKYPWIEKKISLIPISVDTGRFYPQDKAKARKKFKFSPDKKILLFIGRLEYEKNVALIINAFKEIKEANYQLIIVGAGSLEENLKALAEDAENDIVFLGEVDNTVIPEIINSADAMVLTSLFEGSPTVVKEALCCDVPVISTDVGDVKSVLESVNGGVIIEDSVQGFLTGMQKIFSKEKVEIKEASNQFNHTVMGEKTLKIYAKNS